MPDHALKQEIAAQKAGNAATAAGRQNIGSVTNENAYHAKEAMRGRGGMEDQFPNGQGSPIPSPPAIYKYPLDGQADFPARMMFKVKQVDAYTIDTTEVKEYWDVPLAVTASQKLTDSLTSQDLNDPRLQARDGGNPGGTTNTIDPGLKQALEDKQKESNDGSLTTDGAAGVKTRSINSSPIILLYMPQSLVVNDDIAYNQVDLGPGGLTAMAGLNAGQSLLGAIGRGVSEGLESIFNLASGQISGEAAQVSAARISQRIPSVGLRAAAATALQTGVNPGTRILFDRPNIRQFTFQFRFIPTSAAEATQVEKIIRTFREEMYPEELSIINNVPAGYKFPNLFEVDFQFLNSKARFPKMQLSYLRSCQVTYNPNSMTFHADGHPTEIDMTLIFQEYRALAKQDIQKGY